MKFLSLAAAATFLGASLARIDTEYNTDGSISAVIYHPDAPAARLVRRVDTADPPTCRSTKCLLAMLAEPEDAGSFCASYTNGIHTGVADLAPFQRSCCSPRKASAACSCLPVTTTTTQPSAQTTSATSSFEPTTSSVVTPLEAATTSSAPAVDPTTTTTTTTSSTSTETPSSPPTPTCAPAGSPCTINNFFEVCCADNDGVTTCIFIDGNPNNGNCCVGSTCYA